MDTLCTLTADLNIEHSFPFFRLPREIRDEIYAQYCYSNPRSDGPLKGYVEIPSPAPLGVCRQMRAEMSPIFQESLAHTVVQDRVCLKINRRGLPSYSRHVGWNVWESNFESSVRKVNIWIRDGFDKGDYAAWWVDAKNLISMKEFTKLNTPLGVEDAPIAFSQFARVLEMLVAVLPGDKSLSAPKSTLNGVIGRIQHTLREVCKLLRKEDEKASMSLWHRCGNERWQGAVS